MYRRGVVKSSTFVRPVFTVRFYHDSNTVRNEHGAGFIRHDHMTKSVFNRFARKPTTSNAAADLFRTKVHEGLGTGPTDPYERTLPNMSSKDPEKTVLQSSNVTAFTLAEAEMIEKKWGTLGYWLNAQSPRLMLFLERSLVPASFHLSEESEKLLKDFSETGIAAVLKDEPSSVDKVKSIWSTAVKDYEQISKENIFDRSNFELKLTSKHNDLLAKLRPVTENKEVLMSIELLRRSTIVKRNSFLREGIMPLVEQSQYLAGGDAVWRVLFRALDTHKDSILYKQGNEKLLFAYNAIMLEDVTRLPEVTAPVALFFTILATHVSKEVVSSEYADKSSTLDEGLSVQKNFLLRAPYEAVDPIHKRVFVRNVVLELLKSAEGSANLAEELKVRQRNELSRECALCESINNSQLLLEAEAETVCSYFENAAEVKSLLNSIASGKDEPAKKHISDTFGVSKNINWDNVFKAIDWGTSWHQIAVRLLSNESFFNAAIVVIQNAIQSKGVSNRLFSSDYLEELKSIQQTRKLRQVENQNRLRRITDELSSFEEVDEALSIVQSLGVDMSKLEKEAAALREQRNAARCNVDVGLFSVLLQAIAKRHHSWEQAGVLRKKVEASDSKELLEEWVRIFVRLSFVPQAGAAMVAKVTRRRIGKVGTEPFQHNIPAEFGFVEQYDNLQYKRYDWQGWYQRMVDIHNRNVSIRCRLDDLKRLDNYGNPFVDLQAERRLRILSDNRVGMGILKLDSDKYEDQEDNITFGTGKLSELLADARKAQLGLEYWPTVEVKVRKPSGQSQAYYSTIDNDRIEKKSKELYKVYKEAKKRSLFVTPMDTWLDVKGMQVRKTSEAADKDGYTVDMIDAMHTD